MENVMDRDFAASILDAAANRLTDERDADLRDLFRRTSKDLREGLSLADAIEHLCEVSCPFYHGTSEGGRRALYDVIVLLREGV